MSLSLSRGSRAVSLGPGQVVPQPRAGPRQWVDRRPGTVLPRGAEVREALARPAAARCPLQPVLCGHLQAAGGCGPQAEERKWRLVASWPPPPPPPSRGLRAMCATCGHTCPCVLGRGCREWCHTPPASSLEAGVLRASPPRPEEWGPAWVLAPGGDAAELGEAGYPGAPAGSSLSFPLWPGRGCALPTGFSRSHVTAPRGWGGCRWTRGEGPGPGRVTLGFAFEAGRMWGAAWACHCRPLRGQAVAGVPGGSQRALEPLAQFPGRSALPLDSWGGCAHTSSPDVWRDPGIRSSRPARTSTFRDIKSHLGLLSESWRSHPTPPS